MSKRRGVEEALRGTPSWNVALATVSGETEHVILNGPNGSQAGPRLHIAIPHKSLPHVWIARGFDGLEAG